MSLLQYNGVTLPYPFHSDFQQEARYDEEGHTDWYVTRFDITVSCVINTDYYSIIDSTIAAGTPPALIMQLIRAKLLKPRKTLSVTFNGSELIPGKAGVTGTVDAQNGPQPQSCKYTALTNTTFLMTYHIIANYWENNTVTATTSTNAAGNPVLFNRWTETVDIDGCNYSTRTRRGKFVIRSDNDAGQFADQLRTQMAVVGVPPGFLRERSSYTVDPSGLGISYAVVDKEQYRMPPSPAFKATGKYEERTPRLGSRRYGQVTLTLEGDKKTSQNDLIHAAIVVASNQLNTRGAQLGRNAQGVTNVLNEARMTVHMFENKVDLIMGAEFFAVDVRMDQVVASFGTISTSIAKENPNYTPAYLDRGTANIFLHAAAYYDPNVKENSLVKAKGQMQAGAEPGTAGKNPE